jgi:hypothetical protein
MYFWKLSLELIVKCTIIVNLYGFPCKHAPLWTFISYGNSKCAFFQMPWFLEIFFFLKRALWANRGCLFEILGNWFYQVRQICNDCYFEIIMRNWNDDFAQVTCFSENSHQILRKRFWIILSPRKDFILGNVRWLWNMPFRREVDGPLIYWHVKISSFEYSMYAVSFVLTSLEVDGCE